MPIESADKQPDPLAALLPRLYLPLFLFFTLVATWRPLTGREDTYAHAAIGRWIWQHQSVPQHTLWLWGASPLDWIAHSWLSQLTFFSWMAAGGEHLVLLSTAMLAAVPFLLFWREWQRNGQIGGPAALYFMLAVWCACVRFQARPELFSSLFLGFLLLFFIRLPHSLTWRNTVAVMGMFVLWANFHGAVAMGLLVLGLTVLCELVQQKGSRTAWSLVLLACGCILAVNLNPYGLAYWQALRPVGGSMFQMIDEWKSPLAEPALPLDALLLVCSVAVVGFAGWVRNPERRWAQAVWLLLALALFFMARRNLWPCILLCVSVAAANAGYLSTVRREAFVPRLPALGGIIAVMTLLAGSLVRFSPVAIAIENSRPYLRATSPVLPRKAADAVLQHQWPQPVFNDYLRSGYLHWRFAGQPPIYIDLLNAYPDQLMADYFDIIKRTPRGVAEWEKLKVNTVIFGSYQKTDRLVPLAQYLDGSAQWQVVYNAPDGKVWVRKTARQVEN